MSVRFVDLHFKGIRIQQGWRHLKRDVFLAVLFLTCALAVGVRFSLPDSRALIFAHDWKRLAVIFAQMMALGIAGSLLCLLVVPLWNLLHDLQSLCDVIYTYPLYLVRNYISNEALEGADGGKVKREILYFPKMYYRNRHGMTEVTVKLDGSQFHNNGDFENLTKILEESLVLNMVDMTQRREFLTYHLFRDPEKNRIRITEVCPEKYTIPLMRGVSWDIRKAPHALVVGGTGGGKSFFLNALIRGFLLMGATMYICDPKNSSLADYRLVLPDVAVDPMDILENVQRCVDVMEERFRLVKDRPDYVPGQDFSVYGLSPVILLIDEYTAFVSALQKKDRDLFKALVGQIVLKGREAGVFVLLATQRPDASDLDGKVRDQLGFRVALGRMSDDGYRMAFGSTDQKIKGNGKPGQGFLYIDGMRYIQRFCSPFVPEGYQFIQEAGKLLETVEETGNEGLQEGNPGEGTGTGETAGESGKRVDSGIGAGVSGTEVSDSGKE